MEVFVPSPRQEFRNSSVVFLLNPSVHGILISLCLPVQRGSEVRRDKFNLYEVMKLYKVMHQMKIIISHRI